MLTLAISAEVAAALQNEPDLQVEWTVAAPDPTTAEGITKADAVLRLTDEVSDAQRGRVLAVLPAAQHANFNAEVQQHNQRLMAARSPAQRGVPFAALSRLCVGLAGTQSELHLFERDTLDEIVVLDLNQADPRPDLPGFRLVEQSDLFEIYINQTRLELRKASGAGQLSLDAVPTDATETDLALWLARTLRRPAFTDAAMVRWATALLGRLRQEHGFSLTGLLRARHALAQSAMQRLDDLQTQARKRGFEQLTLLAAPARVGGGAGDGGRALWVTGASPDWTFRYQIGQYPARHVYAGRWRFGKHYFEHIHALRDRGEEFECAKVLDAMPEVKHWVRNIEQQQRFSFWLPTATDYFYPDFVAELEDGRLFVVEYKGDAYATNDDSREKNAVGQAWARASSTASANKGVFLMVERLVNGQDMAAQLHHALKIAR